jgi:hypothetical protein
MMSVAGTSSRSIVSEDDCDRQSSSLAAFDWSISCQNWRGSMVTLRLIPRRTGMVSFVASRYRKAVTGVEKHSPTV